MTCARGLRIPDSGSLLWVPPRLSVELPLCDGLSSVSRWLTEDEGNMVPALRSFDPKGGNETVHLQSREHVLAAYFHVGP